MSDERVEHGAERGPRAVAPTVRRKVRVRSPRSVRVSIRAIRRVAPPAYLLAAILIAFPVVDTILAVWPLRPGDVPWRVGTVTLASRSLVSPLLGLVLAYAVAVLSGHRRTLRVFAIVYALTATAFVLLGGLYFLDSLQLRAQVDATTLGRFVAGSGLALAKLAVVVLMAVVLAVAAWKSARRRRRGR